MKRNVVRGWIVLGVVFVIYNLVVFVVPFPKNGVFFISWLFTLISIAVQSWTFKSAFGHEGGLKSKFYGFPIARIGIIYLVIQTIISLILMGLGFWVKIPIWISIVACGIVLGAAAIGLIAADAVREEITVQDKRMQKDISCILNLRQRAASLPSLTKEKEIKKALEQLSEAFRFSDPVSSPSLSSIEVKLVEAMDALESAIISNDGKDISAIEGDVESLLAQRNSLCKLHKNDPK